MSWTQSVFSTMVQEISYDDESSVMTVTFSNGKSYAYEGVPEDLAVQLANAPSVGQMLNSDIKPYYQARKL